jgi:hypothetical protein
MKLVRKLNGLDFLVLFFGIVLSVLVGIASVVGYNRYVVNKGKQCVYYMYRYNSVDELTANMRGLSKIVSTSIYDQITVDDPNRSLYTYFKFKLDPVDVIIMDSRPGYIEYAISNINIDSTRRFALLYRIRMDKIVSFREIELVEMPNNPI